MNLNKVLHIILAVVIGAPPAHARESHSMTPERVLETVRNINNAGLPRAFQNLRDLKLDTKKANEALIKLAASKPAEMSVHLGQTLLFLMAVMGAHIMWSEFSGHLKGQVSDQSMLEMAQIAAKQVLDSGSTYLAIFGAGVAQLGLKYPAEAIGAWLADPASRPILFQSLTRGILSIGGLLGWEFPMSAWTEASYQLETQEEFERSKSLFGMGFGSLKYLLNSKNESDGKDWKLVKTMARNLVVGVLLNEKIRSVWIDSTFRTRIMTGEMAILTAALTAAGVGTMLLPGGGTVIGFMLGVAAVVITINLPDALKNPITRGLQTVRMNVQRSRIDAGDEELIQSVSPRFRPWFTPEQRTKWVENYLWWRHQLRSSYLTINLERARMSIKEMVKYGSKASVEKGKLQLQSVFTELNQFFIGQIGQTEAMIASAGKDTPKEILTMLAAERERVFALAMFFNQVGLELYAIDRPPGTAPISYKSLNPRVQEYIQFIEVSYARGFDEEKIVN
jgi:hypothetical protein